MKPTIAIATPASTDRQYVLNNYFRSLVDLQPEEICFLDTTIEESKEFQKWLKEQGKKYNLPVKIAYKKWSGDFSEARNANLDMCTADWIICLDSDEIITKEVARDLRDKIASLPPEALVLRPNTLNLIDDEYCLDTLWRGDIRAGSGHHGKIFKRGSGRWERRIDEIYNYPGRFTIPWNSEKHPKKDWRGYYLIHLWLYKDAPLRRSRWSAGRHFKEIPEKGIDYREFSKRIIKNRGWKVIKIPKGVSSWIPIKWEDEL